MRAKSTQTFAEGGLLYEFNTAFAVYAGVRYQDLDMDLEFPNVRADAGASWADGMAGVRWTPLVLEHWVAWVRADAGGGSSDHVWLAEAGGGYRWGSRWGAYPAYRVLDTDYDRDDFLYDVRQYGLLSGFGVTF